MSDLSDWAGVVSAAVAAVGLIFVGAQTREAARGTSISIAQTFVSRAGEILEKLSAAANATPPDPAGVELSVQSLISHFELFVIFIHEAPLRDKMRTMIDDTIIGFIDELAHNGYSENISKLICRPEDCRELRDFCMQRSGKFRDYAVIKKMLQIGAR